MSIIIAIVAFLASLLTFFSGFGLGTLLLPIFALFFSIEAAVAMTGIVHFLNNIFKISLIGNDINWNVVKKFGVPAVVGAIIGALLLHQLGSLDTFVIVEWGRGNKVTLFKLVIASLMIVFSLFDIVPFLKELTFDKQYFMIGGLISGFLGGLSGHQGAMRSAFLIKYGLEKKAFIASGVAVACLVDITRLSIYFKNMRAMTITSEHSSAMFIAIVFAFLGAFFGKKFLEKLTVEAVQYFVAFFLIIIAILLGIGII